MLAIAVRTVRGRPVSFAGAIVAAALAVGLVAATGSLMASALTAPGAGRFAAVDAVVQADATITVGQGDAAGGVVTVYPPPRLPVGLVARISAVGGVGRAVGDLAFPATAFGLGGQLLSASGAASTEGHGWASAALTPYRLVAGRPPVSAADVVIDGRLARYGRVRVGGRLVVVVPAGTRQFRVSGIAAIRGGGDRNQPALFFSDSAAPLLARTAGQVNAVGVFAARGVSPQGLLTSLSARLGGGVQVLDRGHAAAADAGDAVAAQRADLISLLATMGACAAVVAVFVVAITFTFAVAQRRRELALLRTIGATPRQVRRMIAGEALVIALIGGAIGCLAALPLAAPIASGLVSHGTAPEGFQPSGNPIPFVIAFATGLVIAEVAASAAAWRAARVRPAEALMQASLEPPGLGPARWVAGLLAVGGGAALIITVPVGGALAGPAALSLAIGTALLSPVLLGFLASALSWPLRAPRGAPGLLASAAVATHRRRAGAVAAPIVLVVALAGTQAITDTTTQATLQHVTAQRVRAPYVLTARAGAGLPAATAQLAGQLPGVTAAAGILPTSVFLLDPGLDNFGSPWDAAGLDPAAVPGTLDLDVQAGSLTSLTGGAVAVSSSLARNADIRVGAILNARLADLTRTRLRVGAIYQRALGLGDILLPRPLAEAHAAVDLDSVVFVSGPPAIRTALAGLPRSVPAAMVLTRAQYLQTVHAAAQARSWPAWLLIALIIGFAALALLNTVLMATAGRQAELTLVRLIGATRRQARQIIAWEALVTTLAGLTVGALIARVAVRTPPGEPGWHIAIPGLLSGRILAGAALLGLAGALVPARLALRSRPMAPFGHGE
jgi:putative ABC transport system permease protein